MDGITNAFENLVKQSSQSVPRNSEDYINPEDGLLYCGRCHAPKQCRVTAFGREYAPFCPCKCVRNNVKRR